MISGKIDKAELLLEYGAKLESDFLFITAAPRRTYGLLMTKFLLDRGADPNVTSQEWGTPLHLAVYAKNPNIVKLLLDAGADPTARSVGTKYLGHSPLEIAQHPLHQQTDVTRTILDFLRFQRTWKPAL